MIPYMYKDNQPDSQQENGIQILFKEGSIIQYIHQNNLYVNETVNGCVISIGNRKQQCINRQLKNERVGCKLCFIAISCMQQQKA